MKIVLSIIMWIVLMAPIIATLTYLVMAMWGASNISDRTLIADDSINIGLILIILSIGITAIAVYSDCVMPFSLQQETWEIGLGSLCHYSFSKATGIGFIFGLLIISCLASYNYDKGLAWFNAPDERAETHQAEVRIVDAHAEVFRRKSAAFRKHHVKIVIDGREYTKSDSEELFKMLPGTSWIIAEPATEHSDGYRYPYTFNGKAKMTYRIGKLGLIFVDRLDDITADQEQ